MENIRLELGEWKYNPNKKLGPDGGFVKENSLLYGNHINRNSTLMSPIPKLSAML